MGTVPLVLRLENSSVLYYELGSREADELHDHDSVHQISIPLFGQPVMQMNQASRQLVDSEWTVTSPGSMHRNFASDEPVRYLIINVNRQFMERVFTDVTGMFRHIEFSPWGASNANSLKKKGLSLLRKTVNDPFISKIEMEEYELQIATSLLSMQSGSHSPEWRSHSCHTSPSELRPVIELIHDQFAEELDITVLMKASGMNRSRVFRIFKEFTGMTPAHYITSVRLGHAESMLTSTRTSITHIAFNCGFADLTTFQRAFKQRYGLSASTYRAEFSK